MLLKFPAVEFGAELSRGYLVLEIRLTGVTDVMATDPHRASHSGWSLERKGIKGKKHQGHLLAKVLRPAAAPGHPGGGRARVSIWIRAIVSE
jgi:hypothetical protein